jgi:hypothetical protein
MLPVSTTYIASKQFGDRVALIVFLSWVGVTIALVVVCNQGDDIACIFAQWLEFVFYVCAEVMAHKQ